MNWTLRVAHDESQPAEVRRLAAESARAYETLRDRIDEALFVLPKERDVVFRGVNIPGLSYRYALSHPVVFPPFTSTSAQGEEARRYTATNGTFFVARSHSAARIDFVSYWPGEAEKLLPSFAHFGVLQKTSATVLRMLECPYDIVTLAEHGDMCTDQEAVDGFVRTVRQTRFIYEGYLANAYVEGKVARLPPPCDATAPVFAYVDQWLAASGHLLLLGVGGSGKTSAMLAMHCRLSTRDGVVPVFVPLPTVSDLFAEGAVDRHLTEVLRLTPAQLGLLASSRTVVLLLESLDEVAVPPGTDVRAMVIGLLARNPLASRARVVLSCRDEFLCVHGVQPLEVFGRFGTHMYVQPFSPEDMAAFVRKQCSRLGLSPEFAAARQEIVGVLSTSMGDSLRNPCILHMACRVEEARIREIVAGTVGRIPASSIYEAFVVQEMRGDETGLRGMQEVSLSMLNRNQWHVTLGDVAAAFSSLGVGAEAFRAVYLPRIPRRVESDADDGGVFAWWHKTIGEYLAARALWTSPTQSLASVGRPFSLDTPGVLAFFGDTAVEHPEQRRAVCDTCLVPAVVRSRGSTDARVLAAASNALALACASTQLLREYDLSGIVVECANLVDGGFTHATLRGATFRGCHLHRANFDFADVRGASFPSSTCEIMLAPIEGHSGTVESVCLSPDGALIASGSSHKTVHVWDAATGSALRTLQGHSDGVGSVCFSPDGALIASGARDSVVRVWNAATGKEVRTLEGHSGPVLSVCFSPDGALIASGSGDGTVRVWDAVTGKEARTLKGHSDGVNGVCFSPDGVLIASGSGDKTVRVWDAATSAQRRMLQGHSDGVSSVCFSPDGALIASGAFDRTARLWDVATGREVRTLSGHAREVISVCFSPDGALIASGSWDTRIRVWDAAAGHTVRTLEGHASPVSSVCFSPDGARIVSGGKDGTVRVWDATAGNGVRAQDGPSGYVMSACFSPNGALITGGSSDCTVRLWDVVTGKEVRTLRGHTDGVNSVCFSADGTLIASGARDGTVRVWIAATGVQLRLLDGHYGFVKSVCFSPDCALIVSGSGDGKGRVVNASTGKRTGERTIRVWDVATGQLVRVMDGHFENVECVCFSPDGALIASGAWDRAVRVWEAATGKEVRMLEGHPGPVCCVRFSPDGALIASGSGDEMIVRVWSVATGKEVRTLEGHELDVNSVCFSPEGALIASASHDRTVRVWDAATGKEVRALVGHCEDVRSVCFSSDGALIVSSSGDGTVRVWDATGLDAPTESQHPAAAAGDDSVTAESRAGSYLRAIIRRPSRLSSFRAQGPLAASEGASRGLYSCFASL